MTAPKLTPVQRRVLAQVAAGRVWRYMSPISRWGGVGLNGRRNLVTPQVRALLRAGLIEEGQQRGLVLYAELTDAGRAYRSETTNLNLEGSES